MHSGNQWGGPLEILGDHEQSAYWDNSNKGSTTSFQHDMNHLNDTQKSWLLEPKSSMQKKKSNIKYIDLGCVVCSRKALKLSLLSFFVAFLVIGLPIIIVKTLPKPKPRPVQPDDYTLALHKTLLFFNAQKCKSLYIFTVNLCSTRIFFLFFFFLVMLFTFYF